MLHRLACSVSSSERQFERYCRSLAEATGISYFGLRRQTIHDAATHALSAQKVGAIHTICGVRFGSLVWELMGIDLNSLASWHAAAYPDQTIRLPDYLWNPELMFRCPAALAPLVEPATNSAVDSLVQEWTSLPLSQASEAGDGFQVYRIGDVALQPLLHPGDLVLVESDRQPNLEPREERHRQRPVMMRTEGRYQPCWTRSDLKTAQAVGPIVAFYKNLRPNRPETSPVTYGPMRRRSDEDRSVVDPGNEIGRIIRSFRLHEGVALKALIARLKNIESLLPEYLACEIPSIGSLSAMERETSYRPKLTRLLLISIAIKADLRYVLRAAGVTVADKDKVSVAERLGWRQSSERGLKPLNGLLRHPLAAGLARKWKALPWLVTQLFTDLNPNSVFYMGRRSPFMHPMLADQSFVMIDRKRTILPQAGSQNVLEGTTIEGWPPAYMLEVRKTGQLICANCRRDGNAVVLLPYDQFGGQRMTLDLQRDVVVLGEVSGVASCLP
ncbi:MAG TPA: hypothetical protein VGZ73_07825 [Bryobacteraceae bacterium]|nr:hypothetical protein [Bryobacteraceae bacterium]